MYDECEDLYLLLLRRIGLSLVLDSELAGNHRTLSVRKAVTEMGQTLPVPVREVLRQRRGKGKYLGVYPG